MANFIKGTDKMVGEAAFNVHVDNKNIHVTEAEKTLWDNAAENAMYTTNEDGQTYLSDAYMETFFAAVRNSRPELAGKQYGIQWCAWPDTTSSTAAAVNLPWAADEMVEGQNYIKKLGANAGLVGDFRSEGVTSEEAPDDYETIPIFMWWHVNFIKDKHGNNLPIAIEGMSNYKTNGDADVGTMMMRSYIKYVETTDSDVAPDQFPDGCPVRQIWLTDTAGDGWAPVSECVRHDGTVAPYAIRTTYISVEADDGMWRSQPGKRPIGGAYGKNYSYASFLDGYRQKGEGWQGGSMEVYVWGWTMAMMKYGAKSTSTLSNGFWGRDNTNTAVTGLLVQEAVTTSSSSVAILATDAVVLVPGSIVTLIEAKNSVASSITSAFNSASWAASAGYTSNKGINCATVLSITPRSDSSGLVDVQLDATSTVASAAKTVQLCPGKVLTGMTDHVMRHRDGTLGGAQSGWNPWRIAGIEFGYGHIEVPLDVVYTTVGFDPDTCSYDYMALWVAPKGFTRIVGDDSVASAEIEANYVMAGKCIYSGERTFVLSNGLVNYGTEADPKYTSATFMPTYGLTNTPTYSYDKAYGDYADLYPADGCPSLVWLGSLGAASYSYSGYVGLSCFLGYNLGLSNSDSGFSSRC